MLTDRPRHHAFILCISCRRTHKHVNVVSNSNPRLHLSSALNLAATGVGTSFHCQTSPYIRILLVFTDYKSRRIYRLQNSPSSVSIIFLLLFPVWVYHFVLSSTTRHHKFYPHGLSFHFSSVLSTLISFSCTKVNCFISSLIVYTQLRIWS
jgi:hypothetical protein